MNSDRGADPRIVRLSIGVEEAEVSVNFIPLASELTIIPFQGSQARLTPGSAEVVKGIFLLRCTAQKAVNPTDRGKTLSRATST